MIISIWFAANLFQATTKKRVQINASLSVLCVYIFNINDQLLLLLFWFCCCRDNVQHMLLLYHILIWYATFFSCARARAHSHHPKQIKFAIKISTKKYTHAHRAALGIWLWHLRRDKIAWHWIIVDVGMLFAIARTDFSVCIYVADATVLQTINYSF